MRTHYKNHQIPKSERINRGPSTETLYRAEARAITEIGQAAEEYARLKGITTRPAYWQQALPATLAQMLDSHETDAGTAAAIAHLRQHAPEVLALSWLADATAAEIQTADDQR